MPLDLDPNRQYYRTDDSGIPPGFDIPHEQGSAGARRMMGLPRAGRKHLPRHHRIRRWTIAIALAAVGLLFVLWGWWKPTGYISDGLSAAVMFLGIGCLATGVVVALSADERTQKWVIIAALAAVASSLVLCRPF